MDPRRGDLRSMSGQGTSAWPELKRHWPTLLGATIGAAFGSAALPFYTAGLFIVQLEQAFGWTRTELTAIGLATTLTVAVAAPFAGALFDRVGIRGPALVGFAALAANFVYMSQLQGSLVQYAIVHLALAVLMMGTSPIAFTRPVNFAFDRMRGLALGITIGGIGAMAAVAPPIVAQFIETNGWRAAYLALAAAVIVAGPLALLLVGWRAPDARRSPEPAAVAQRLVTPIRSRLFWRLVVSFVLIALAVAGFVTHFVPMLTDGGMSTLEAARVAGLLGVAVLVGRLGVGWLVDLYFAPYVAAGIMALTAGGLALLALGGPDFAVVGAIAVGLAMGAEVDLIAYLTARYYGMSHYGRMYGLLYGAFVIGTGASPYVISLIQAASGSYAPALWMSVALLAIVTVLFLTAPRFDAPPEDEGLAADLIELKE
jgi:MFS family permease